nr:hypothetical protein [Deltaproteobacteria bacterium]
MLPPRKAPYAWSAALRAAALLVTAALATTRCASGACDLNSDCVVGTYCGSDHQCRYDCYEDRDCNDGSFCNRDRGRCQVISADAGVTPDAAETPDAGVVKKDAGETPMDVSRPRDMGVDVPVAMDVPVAVDVPVAMDMGPPPVDVGPPPVDMGPPPVDLGSPGRAAYLDACMTNDDCASGECLTTSGGARFCTRRCVSTIDCADGFLCDSPPAGRPARCVPDDTGTACDARTAVPCARFCVGNPVTGLSAHCTHECRTAADCPAGYGCQDAGGGQRVCIAAEQPCSRGTDCTTNLCVGTVGGFQGCTSRCTSDSDCPRRMTVNVEGLGRFALPPYQCRVVEGERICVPPLEITGGDLSGSNELGASCGAGGVPLCRSGVCDSETNVCVQGCTPAGGCPSGFVCRPWVDGADIYLVCRRSVTGNVLIGGRCSVGADCASGLCQGSSSGGPGYCTRFCSDRLCPTGMRCTPLGSSFDGTPISLCQP